MEAEGSDRGLNTKVISLAVAVALLFSIFSSLAPVLNTAVASTNTVNLSTPCIEDLQVDINGGATNGQNILKIVFNWGDGTIQNHFFPDEHTYKSSGSYTITVTAYYNDGSTASAKTTVKVGPGVGRGCDSLLVSSSLGGLVNFVRDGNITGKVQAGGSQALYVAQGDDLELTGIPDGVGFSFSSWTITGPITFLLGNSSASDIFIAVNGNSSIDASFREPSSGLASCSPSAGSTIEVGQTVSCTFGGNSVTWFATDFSPSGLIVSHTQTFTAASNGKGAITASYGCTVNGIATVCVETFTYNIIPSTLIATCTPTDGASIQLDTTVSCQFIGGGGIKFNGWGASLFTPFQSTSQNQVFTSFYEGKGEVTISWADSSGATNYESFTYQIGPNTAIASCTPDTGSTIQLYTYVTCQFTGTGTFGGWSGGNLFSPPQSSSPVETFEATSTGSGSITAFWSGTSASGPTSESFTYTISPSTGIATCSPGNGAKIQLGSKVSCEFVGTGGGNTFLGWGSSLFTPAQSSNLDETFTAAVPGPGSGSITVSWADSSGTIHEETFGYNIANQNTIPPSALVIQSHSPVNILLTDSAGRKVGSDGINNYNQIPGAFYSGMGQEPQIIGLPAGIPGNYTIEAFGTGPGSYLITLSTTNYTGNILGSQIISGIASLGGIQSYSLKLASNGRLSVTLSTTPPVGVPEFPYSAMIMLLMIAVALPLVQLFRKRVMGVTSC